MRRFWRPQASKTDECHEGRTTGVTALASPKHLFADLSRLEILIESLDELAFLVILRKTTETTMKTPLSFIAALAFAGTAFAGQAVVTTTVYQSSEYVRCSAHVPGIGFKDAGSPGTYYKSNCGRNAVLLVNDTPEFMTFFVYFGDLCSPNDINHMIWSGAQVYETVVPPFTRSFSNQRAKHYWVGTKPGKWGIDMAKNRVAPLQF